MTAFSLETLTRDSFVVRYDHVEYIVSGERGGDGVWEIFPKMVYRTVPDERPTLLDDEALKASIVSALVRHWPQYGYEYTLKVVEDG